MTKAKKIVKDKMIWKKDQDKNLKAGSMIDAPIPKPHKQKGFPGSTEIEVNTNPADKFFKEDAANLKSEAKRNAAFLKEETARREKIRGKKPE